MRAVGRDRHHHRLVWRVRPGALRHRGKTLAQPGQMLGGAGAMDERKRPACIAVPGKIDARRCKIRRRSNARDTGKAGMPLAGFDQVEQHERHVQRVRRQCQRSDRAGFLGGLGFARPCAQVAQHDDPTLADHLPGDFRHRREHAADAAGRGLVRNRAVGDREVGFLDEAVPIDLERDVVVPRRRAAKKRRVDQRLQHVPYLAPAFPDRAAQRPGMLGAEDGPVRIVVDADVVRPPPQQLRKPVGLEQPDHHAQRR